MDDSCEARGAILREAQGLGWSRVIETAVSDRFSLGAVDVDVSWVADGGLDAIVWERGRPVDTCNFMIGDVSAWVRDQLRNYTEKREQEKRGE